MIRVKDYSGDLVQLEVQISKYIEGGCLAVVLLEPGTEDLYTVLSRNIEEAIPKKTACAVKTFEFIKIISFCFY